jgi:hypothetical protein
MASCLLGNLRELNRRDKKGLPILRNPPPLGTWLPTETWKLVGAPVPFDLGWAAFSARYWCSKALLPLY